MKKFIGKHETLVTALLIMSIFSIIGLFTLVLGEDHSCVPTNQERLDVADVSYTDECPPPQQSTMNEGKPEPPTVAELFRLTNEERAKVGVKPLKLDPKLNKSALLKVQDMYEYGYSAHINPTTKKNGLSYIFESYPECPFGSENITGGGTTLDSSGKIIDQWMQSPSHKKALLSNRYDFVGFYVSADYTVQHFCDIM